MPSYPQHSPVSPPRSRWRDHSPTKSSPLRTVSTRSDGSNTDNASLTDGQDTLSSNMHWSDNHGSPDPWNTPVDEMAVVPAKGSRDDSRSAIRSKNAAFARWEERAQVMSDPATPRPPVQRMNVSPKKIRDDEWKSGIGVSESRSVLRPVESNTRAQPTPLPLRDSSARPHSPSKENDIRPPSRDGRMHPPPKPPSHIRSHSLDASRSTTPELAAPISTPPLTSRNSLATISRSDSIRARTRPRKEGHVRFASTQATVSGLDGEDIALLQNSSTPHLRHLSTMASEGSNTEDLSVRSPDEQVAGLAGRRKLRRSGSVRPSLGSQRSMGSQYTSTKWMDAQRRHLQAYEYLCHIGEARQWLQDVLEPAELPPIVRLEEALRDGVTFAEVVVRLAPLLHPQEQSALGSQRIFRNPRLQFRHSDNIALFFRFLGVVDLPDLFRFELVDLYEKKNVPKVIYCIHALSWLLLRKGLVDFRIGNLVGQLQFEEHELEETQKGIDRSGVAMPNFGGMREAMQVEEEPKPEITTDDLLIQQEHAIADLQAQARGCLVRMRLGEVMNELWDVEPTIASLQAVARKYFATQVYDFKISMERSTRLFQAASKAFLIRRRLTLRKCDWRDSAAAIVTVQSLWRGKQQRVSTKLLQRLIRGHWHGLTTLQAAIRGALSRWKAGDMWNESHDPAAEAAVAEFQGQARGALERMRIAAVVDQLWAVEDEIGFLQSRVRGAQVRNAHKRQEVAARQEAVNVTRVQSAARGLIQRQAIQRQHGNLEVCQSGIAFVQAAARGLIARLSQARMKGALLGRGSTVVGVQALLRAHHVRKAIQVQHELLTAESTNITRLQAHARAQLRRESIVTLRRMLTEQDGAVLHLQSLARATLQRASISVIWGALEKEDEQISALQALARAYLERQRIFEHLVAVEEEQESIVHTQAFARATLLRSHVGSILSGLEASEAAITATQAACRAFVVRHVFAEKRRHYHENMQKVIKVQSFVRAKQQGESYKSLVNGKNPPLPVVRRHLHLLTDNHLDFESELEGERLRRQVVESVRRNELVEGYVEGLDVKIALLVKNKITLDEVVKHQKHFGGSASQLLRSSTQLGQNAGGLDLKALNKSSRKKLVGYEELFFIVQTQPMYLARLFYSLTSKGMADKEVKSLESMMNALFGYAQKNREEYLFLKLLAASQQLHIERSQSLDDHFRNQNGAFHQRLFLSHVRSLKDRAFLKALFGPMVKDGICGQDHMDLESDPLQIYRAILNNEELSTGRPSARPRDLPREMAIREHDVRPTYVQHLQDLRDLCDSFFMTLEDCLHRLPFGARYVAAEQYRTLRTHFPREDSSYLAIIAGQWLWKNYMLPALKEPEMWGIVDRGLSPLHKRNLGQVVTVLGQVAAGRLFGVENLYLQPLNNWISESIERWHEVLHQLFYTSNPEEHFDADQFSDLYARTKPTLYIKLSDIFALHSLIADNVSAVAPARDDLIKELLTDLGSAKGNEVDLIGAAHGGEITLTLKSRFAVKDDPHAEARALFTATKRLVLHIIKIQSGSNLMEILLRPISQDDARKWTQLVRDEIAEQEYDNRHPKRTNPAFDPRASLRGARTQSVYSEANSNFSEERRDLLDLESMTYAELKSTCLENILTLEQSSTPPQYRVSRHNNYQELLNALAADIRQKHRRRIERQREVESTRATLAQLDAKAAFLEDQLRSYNDYIEQCLHTLASKKGARHKFLMPFTKQWSHERELERAGRQPKFGSYKYSARQLADKGVLLSWAGYSPEHWSQLNIVISSDEVGVFHLEASLGSMMLPGAATNLLLDDLLQAQYDNRQAIAVFEEMQGSGAKVSVNLLLHLVFKKFYRDD